MLEAMLLFLKVVQFGSMSAAGKAANLSAASVSRTIASLEQTLGVQLFNRTSRKIVLTDAGEAYYQRIKPVLEELREIETLTREKQGEPEGFLRVHAHTSVGLRMVAPRLEAFCRLYPKITIDLQLSETPVDLLEENFDVDIRLGELEDSTMLARRLAASDRMLVASPAYLDSRAPISKPEDLLRHSCLTFRPGSQVTTWRFARDGGKLQEIKVTGAVHSNNAEVLRQLAVAGLGIALLTGWISQADRQAGRLRAVLPDYRVTINSFNNGIFAVFRQARYVPKKIRVFVDFLAAHSEPEQDSPLEAAADDAPLQALQPIAGAVTG